jgi:mannose/fructose/N-acetylgalactosamine-specific phosphotransferase system component IIC
MILTAGPLVLLALVAWGTLAGLDLVSFPQVLLSRPLVAAILAGGIMGDPAAGARVGVLLELFALDVLPVGAVRYPDYGPAAVAAAALAAGSPWELSVGVAGALGLALGQLGGWGLRILRRVNARRVQARAAGLRAGETRTIRLLQWSGIAGDILRSLLLTLVGLTAAVAVARWFHPDRGTALALDIVMVGSGTAAAIAGAWRSAGLGVRVRWLAAGLGLGLLVAVLR